MANLAKVIEVLADGDSIEAATEAAVQEASQSVRNIQHVYIKEIQAYVDDDQITHYRVNAKVTFQVEGRDLG